MTVDAHVAVALTTAEIDLCIIIGNLFDNAIEANMALPKEERMIRALHGYEEHTAIHVLYQPHCGKEAAQGKRAVSDLQGNRAWLWAGAD